MSPPTAFPNDRPAQRHQMVAQIAHHFADSASQTGEQALAGRAEETLQRLGYTDVEVRSGDGYLGWPEQAPLDAILVTAGAQEITAFR
jgi:protein-L-isoaspartate O-methyltransferase